MATALYQYHLVYSTRIFPEEVRRTLFGHPNCRVDTLSHSHQRVPIPLTTKSFTMTLLVQVVSMSCSKIAVLASCLLTSPWHVEYAAATSALFPGHSASLGSCRSMPCGRMLCLASTAARCAARASPPFLQAAHALAQTQAWLSLSQELHSLSKNSLCSFHVGEAAELPTSHFWPRTAEAHAGAYMRRQVPMMSLNSINLHVYHNQRFHT